MVAVDVDGEQSSSAVVSISFSTACSQWLDTMIVVPMDASLEQIGQCSSIDTSIELRIGGSSSVVSLLPLGNLQVRCMVYGVGPPCDCCKGFFTTSQAHVFTVV